MAKKKAEEAEQPESSEQPASTQAGPRGRADGRLTPLEIQQVEFRRSFKGYDEREVDEFLDRLTEDFAAALEEAKRARERLESGLGAVGTPDPAEATRQADEILQRARDEAARVLSDAERRAGGLGAGTAAIASGDTAAIQAFIAKERAFLQSLASLVQDHAEGVKRMVRSSVSAPSSPSPAQAPPRSSPSAKVQTPADPEPQPAQTGDGTDDVRDAAQPASGPMTEPMAPVEPAPQAPPADPAPQAAPADPAAPEPPISVPEPEPRTVTTRGVPDEQPATNDDDRSLRELFWGDEK